MGIAAGTAVRAHQLFQQCEKFMGKIPNDYSANFQTKLTQSKTLADQATDKAQKVFFEQIPPADKIRIPDLKNFVRLDDSLHTELDATPSVNEILRHVIPPQVRKMQAEFS